MYSKGRQKISINKFWELNGPEIATLHATDDVVQDPSKKPRPAATALAPTHETATQPESSLFV